MGTQPGPIEFQIQFKLGGLKVILTDPNLGVHVPLIKLIIGDLTLFLSRMTDHDLLDKDDIRSIGSVSCAAEAKVMEEMATTSSMTISSPKMEGSTLPAPSLNVSVVTRLWADYYNNTLKCWEPLLEPFSTRVLYEQSNFRGQGLTIRAMCPLLLNVSSVFLNMLAGIKDVVTQIPPEIFGWEKKYLLLFSTVYCPDMQELIGETIRSEPAIFKDDAETLEVEDLVLDSCVDEDLNDGHAQLIKMSVCHQFPRPLQDVRTAFSLINLTGQRLRYHQSNDRQGDKRILVQYLRHGERGALTFGATMSVLRNLRPVEVPFDLQRELVCPGDEPLLTDVEDSPMGDGKTPDNDDGDARPSATEGWTVALQLAGYRWIPGQSADVLGVRFHNLVPLLRQVDVSRVLNDWRINNALKMVSEVRLHKGCRQLTLRSVFRIKNCTKHDIVLVAHPDLHYRPSIKDADVDGKSSGSTVLSPSGVYNIPLLLLHMAMSHTLMNGGNETSLGNIWLRPRSWQQQSVVQSRSRKDEIHFSNEPLVLKELVLETAQLYAAALPTAEARRGRVVVAGRGRHLICPIIRGNTHNRTSIPPISYCMEVVRTGMTAECEEEEVTSAAEPASINEPGAKASQRKGVRHRNKKEHRHNPVEYTILIHPPLVLENLLPEASMFELHDSKTKTLLWKAHFQAGQSLPVHDVRLDYPLLLIIQTEYCRSPEGALIHKGDSLGQELEVAKSLSLVDADNKKITLLLHHSVGGAGQRRVTVYCPYWIINHTNCMMVYRQEGKSSYPAGTMYNTDVLGGGGTNNSDMRQAVTDKEDPDSHGLFRTRHANSKVPLPADTATLSTTRVISVFSTTSMNWQEKKHKLFPGEAGLQEFHMKTKQRLKSSPTTGLSTRFTDCFDMEELCQASFMFNFGDDSVLSIGQRRLQVKVNNSNWSKGFSLDTVGVNQILTVRHPSVGNLDLGFIINLAPGRLGQFTKIVYFCPRYVLWNRHNLPLCLVPDSRYFRMEAMTNYVKPEGIAMVHVHHSLERRVTVQLKGAYDKSTPFLIDESGELALKLSKQADLSRMRHLMTRKATEFDLTLPANQEIGVWLETDWNRENIVVKSIKGNKYAGGTELHKGDVLLQVDGQPVNGRDFKDVIAEIRLVLSKQEAMLRFRTHEEHMRLLRLKAMGKLDDANTDMQQTQSQSEPGTRNDKVGADY